MFLNRLRPSQTLLEAVIAIGVILVSVIGSSTLIVTTISAGQSSEDKIVASNLAREAIEVIRGIRDSNWMKRSMNEEKFGCAGVTYDWNTRPAVGCSAPTLESSQFNVPTMSVPGGDWSLDTCGSTACPDNKTLIYEVRSNDGTASYFSNAWSLVGTAPCTSTGTCVATKYHRQIQITKPTETILGSTVAYLNVTATITWESHGSHTYTVTERFYDWR